MIRKIVILFLLMLLVSIGFSAWLFGELRTQHAPAQPVELMIPKGASTTTIARLLAEHDLIRSPLAFRLLARMEDSGGQLRSGYYRFAAPATLKTIMQRLQQGDVMRFQVTIPEGLRSDEIAQLLAKETAGDAQQWLTVMHRLLGKEIEGRLLPETYQYVKPIDKQLLIRSMIHAQQRILNTLTSDASAQQRIRIIASIIEKETRLAKERPLVAAVIRNRLQRGMPLQMDPTVIYGLWRTTGSFSGNIHKRDLTHDTPWSTYTRKGLPPTPICNPGEASLRAAAAPADVPFLYFVADGSGGHQFAATLADHQANVRRWIHIERQRQRKSDGK